MDVYQEKNRDRILEAASSPTAESILVNNSGIERFSQHDKALPRTSTEFFRERRQMSACLAAKNLIEEAISMMRTDNDE